MFNFDSTFLQSHLFVQCLTTMACVCEHHLNIIEPKDQMTDFDPSYSRIPRSNALLDAVDVEFKKYEESCGYDVIL